MLELAQVSRVLRDEWDPLYVNEIPEAAEEYDSYAPALLGLVLKGADENAIAAHLLALETDVLGLEGDPARAARVARLALESAKGPH
jgi:hypothetical protein